MKNKNLTFQNIGKGGGYLSLKNNPPVHIHIVVGCAPEV